MAISLFGFEIKRKDEEEQLPSFVEPNFDDGAVNVTASGTNAVGSFGHSYLDMEGTAKNEAELITKYRQMEQQPEVSRAIDDIVNDAIVVDEEHKVVDINLDDTDLSDKIKKLISEEFENVLKLLDFSNKGYDIFLRWYVDGRIRYHVVIDENNTKLGIQELRFVDPRKLRKIKEIEKMRDNQTEIILKRVKNEYWLYNDKGFAVDKNQVHNNVMESMESTKGVKVAKDSIVESHSGILNENNTLILSHLHKSMRTYNQLRMLEDAAVIYRLARAPERRVWNIDVGNLPKMKAEQYLRDMMVRHKNRLVYDASTGEVRDDRRHMTILEDFWLPKREGGKGTTIDTLPGGQNLGEMDDILYFQKNLYKALNVPITRLESETGFSLGRASEITRDEVKFGKFIDRLRTRFSMLFDEILERQLMLKNVMTIDEWKEIKDVIRYDFKSDSHFEELKEAEIMRERSQSLQELEAYVGTYFSKEWIRKNVLKMSENEIKEMEKQMEKENKESEEDGEDDMMGGGFGGQPPQEPQQPAPMQATIHPMPNQEPQPSNEETAKKEEFDMMIEEQIVADTNLSETLNKYLETKMK